jgi:cysteine desulfurase
MNNFGATSHHPGLADGPIYLDYNATTPVDPRVSEAAQPYLTTHFGNPSSAHTYAERPHRALAEARQQLAGLIGAEPAEMVCTASGSEANNLAIRGSVLANDRTAPARIITQASEHPAVIETCSSLQRLHGVQVRYLPVDRDGRVDPAALAKTLTPDTAWCRSWQQTTRPVCYSPSPNWRPSPMPAASSSTPTPPKQPGRSQST